MAVTNEEILWAYRMILGRDPEGLSAYESHAISENVRALCTALFSSAEFADNNLYHSVISVKRQPFGGVATGFDFIAHTTKRVLVVSGCQAEPIAKHLQALSGATVESKFLSSDALHALCIGTEPLPPEWMSFDLVLTQKPALLDRVRSEWQIESAKWQLLPLVVFDGFHPDQSYLYRKSDGREIVGPMGVYHSTIATAGFFAGFSANDVVAFFRDDVFEALGYVSRFDEACTRLQEQSKDTAVPLDTLIQRWNEQGRWMRTLNHPFPHVLSDIVKTFLQKNSVSFEYGADQYVRDDLSDLGDWPTTTLGKGHPAYRFRVPGALSPDRRGIYFMDLPALVRRTFQSLQGFGMSDVRIDTLAGEIEIETVISVLRRFL